MAWLLTMKVTIRLIHNKFKGLTGQQLLELDVNKDLMADIDGELMSVIPRTLPHNCTEIASYDTATHVGVKTRFMHLEQLIKI
jgi:hypothetical protein